MGRAPCCDKNGLKKGPWTPEEDLKLTQYIQIHGPGNWRSLPKNAGLQRCGKSCRLRWTNYLRPDIKRGRFSFEEEESIIQLHSILGNKWSAIAARLPGRTDNEIKNYWNTHIRKRLLRNGIDPVTHSPRLDLLDLSSIFASSQLNLSNFLGLQALLNPEILRLATTLLAPTTNQENQEMVLQSHQENQLPNSTQPLQNLTPMLQPNNTQNPIQEVPCASSHDQTQFTQGMNVAQFAANSTDFTNFQKFQDHLATSSLNPGFDNTLQNYSYNISDSNFAYDSVKSTPSSSQTPLSSSSTFINSSSQTPLTSSSTFINSGTEDERESYCSDLFKFEIPESLDFDDFM